MNNSDYEKWSKDLLYDFCRDYDPNSPISKIVREHLESLGYSFENNTTSEKEEK
jgi:hypothetical protein